MARELKTSPAELESAFVACLKAVDDLMEARKVLEADLRAGFLDVARARYAMGPMRVSSLQYDVNRMETTAFVVATLSDGQSERNSASPNAIPSWEWSLRRKVPDLAQPAQPPTETMMATSIVPEGGLRRRGTAGGGTRRSSASEVLEEARARPSEDDSKVVDPGSSKKRGDTKSPLRWFGGLVSPHLHHAQLHFVTALEHVMDAARAQSRLQAAQARFDQLRGISSPPDADEAGSRDGDSDGECITDECGGL